MSGEKLYLRFGEIPQTGCSANWRGASGSTLCGVSCFKARRTDEGEVEVDISSGLQLALVFLSFETKPLDALLIRGREVGVGNCGEPLLTNVELVERLSPRPRIKALGHYWLQRWLGRQPTTHEGAERISSGT